MNSHSKIFSCPECNESLQIQSSFVYCSFCKSNYPVKGLFVDFRKNTKNNFEYPLTEQQMDSLINQLNKDNWSDIIQKYIAYTDKKSPSAWLENLVVDGRYAWKLFLDLNKEKTLLEINCGLGNLISNVAPHVGKTYALDLNYKKLEFTEKRISIKSNSDQVEYIAAGDLKYLPFAANSIDCVVLSDFLERTSKQFNSPQHDEGKVKLTLNLFKSVIGESSPRNKQLNFLKEIKRVLKTDGQLFFGVENRFNYEYFTGYPEQYTGLKYISLLPRFIANIYSIVKNKMLYRAYTYTIFGYKKLFKEAGFNSVEVLGFTPGYTFLDEIHATDIKCSYWMPESINNLKLKIKNNKYFIQEYGIIASEIKKPRSRLQDKILLAVEDNLKAIGDSLVVKKYLITGKGKVVIKAVLGDKNLIIKIPLNETSVAAEMQNKILLEYMANQYVCPDFLCHIKVEEFTCFVEEEVLGSEYQKADCSDIYSQVTYALQAINPKSSLQKIDNFSGSLYKELVEKPIKQLCNHLQDQKIYHLLKQYFEINLYRKKITIGISHGDCSVSNVFLSPEGCRVIDWEAGCTNGIPVLDAINFIGSNYRFKQKAGVLESIIILTVDIDKTSDWWLFLENQYDYFDIDSDLHVPLVYLNWLNAVNCVYPHKLQYEKDNVDKFVYEIAKSLKKYL